MTEAEWFKANREMWDERVPIHLDGDFYDTKAVRDGGVVLRDFEIEEVGDVQGRTLVHLQCHFGLDSLSWARLGATVTGLDFSPPAIEAANELAQELGLDASFMLGNVYDAPELLNEQQFDIVYTGLGAINWLPDLPRWARVIGRLVKPGGLVFVPEFHPFSDVFADEDLSVEIPYFQGSDPVSWDTPGTYADLDAPTTNNECYEWVHPVSETIMVLLGQGLVLESFREYDYTLFPRWPFLERREKDSYYLPAGMPSLPLMYSVKLRRPA